MIEDTIDVVLSDDDFDKIDSGKILIKKIGPRYIRIGDQSIWEGAKGQWREENGTLRNRDESVAAAGTVQIIGSVSEDTKLTAAEWKSTQSGKPEPIVDPSIETQAERRRNVPTSAERDAMVAHKAVLREKGNTVAAEKREAEKSGMSPNFKTEKAAEARADTKAEAEVAKADAKAKADAVKVSAKDAKADAKADADAAKVDAKADAKTHPDMDARARAEAKAKAEADAKPKPDQGHTFGVFGDGSSKR